MNNLLNALDGNIKPAGLDKWIARCPVHNDKDYAMSIKQVGDGSVVAHCHACGANGYHLYTHLGLDLDELFGGKKLDKDPLHIPQKAKEDNKYDQFLIAIRESAIARGDKLTLDDKKHHRLSVARDKGFKDKYKSG